ncbi:hypothetical protein SCARR_00421 [Pontiella sulfatireligans]|uniref:PKD domain-containing protein n=2 Tax=Pontiella sulfatireligans TaxID=2750658 RepID=A0A6C2UEM7_9BACT|nr:hypothetical protein SCARR_00421 [Pontiella sulfatireligans]
MGLISVPDAHASVNLNGLTPVGVTTVDRQSSWESLFMGAPIADDDASDGFGVRVKAFSADGLSEAVLPVLNDGLAATQDNDPVQSVSFSGDGYFGLTLPGRTDVEKINTYSRKDDSSGNEAARQLFTLWGSNEHEMLDPVFTNGLASGWEYIAQVDTAGAFNGGLHGSSVAAAGGGALGTYCHLLWVVEAKPTPTLFAEVDVIAVDKGYPEFSWDKIPLNMHIGASYTVWERDENGDPILDGNGNPRTDMVHGLTAAETAEVAARYDFITLTGGSWTGEYFDEVAGAEEVYSQAAQDIKALNPDAKVLFYWPPDGLKPHYAETLNLEGPAEKFVQVNENYKYLAVANPAVRDWWTDIAGRTITQYNCDGVFIDGYSSHTPGHPASSPYLSIAENEVLNNLRFTMWEEARAKMGPVGMQILNPIHGGWENDAGTGGGWDHLMATDGAMIDNFIRADMDTLDDSHFIDNIVTLSTAAKEGKVMILKAWPEFNWIASPYSEMTVSEKNQLLYERREFPMACFLIGAGKYSYLCYSWGWSRDSGSLNSWGSGDDAGSMMPIPEYEKSLGAPLGDYERYGLVFTREFEHAFVYVDIKNRESHIEWAEDYTNLIVMSSAFINSEYAGSLSEALPGASGFSKIDGPAWLQVAADGSLSGTPAGSDQGMNYLNVSYSDGQSTTGTVRILVLNRPPVADAGADQNVTLMDQGLWTPEKLQQCTAWYDAADTATITASGGRVSQWDDKSSNGYHMTQEAEASQPINQPGESVSFSGGGYYLNNANALANAIDYNNTTVIMMLNANAASGCLLGNAYGGAEVGVAARFPVHFGIGTLFGSSVGIGPTIGSDEITSMFNNPLEEKGLVNVFADEKLTEDNEVGIGLPTYTSFSLGAARAASGYSCDAYLREVIIAPGLSTLDRQMVEGYLAHKWEMSANLPAEHPFKAVAPGGFMVSANLSGVGNDPDGDAVSAVWSKESGPGEVSFVDPFDFNTTATFYVPGTYTLRLVVSDDYGATDSDTVTVTVEWDGQFPPVADPQSVNVEKNTFVDITLTGSDWEGSNLIYSVESNPTNGALTGTAPDLTYTPDTNYTGPDSFTFTVNDGVTNSASATVSISVYLQEPPVADPQSVNVEKNTFVDIILTGSDPEGSNLTYSVTDTLTHGVLTGTAPDLTYTPDTDYTGPDSFTFTVNDGETNSEPATVSIWVYAQPAGTLYEEDFSVDPGYVGNNATAIGAVGSANAYFTFGDYNGTPEIGVTTGTGVLHFDSNTTGSSARSRGLSVFIDTSAATAGIYTVLFEVSNWVAGTGTAGFKVHEGSGLNAGYIELDNADNNDAGSTPNFGGTAASTLLGSTWGAGAKGTGISSNGTVSFDVELTEAGESGDWMALAWVQVRSTDTAMAPKFDVDNVWVGQGAPPMDGSSYSAWSVSYNLTGDDALESSDVEPDGLDNLAEYALGGNPTNADADAVAPVAYVVTVLGTNWFYLVHNRRTDDQSLRYTLGTKTNLTGVSWDTNDVHVVGESVESDGFKTVTNRTEAATAAKFIKLEVSK